MNKKRGRRLLAWLLAVIITATSAPVTTFAAEVNTSAETSVEEPAVTDKEPVQNESSKPGQEAEENQQEKGAQPQEQPEDQPQAVENGQPQLPEGTADQGDTPQEGAVQPEVQQPEKRQPADFTENREELHISLEKVNYRNESGADTEIKAEDKRMDLTGLTKSELQELTLGYFAQFVHEGEEKQVQEGDSFHIVIPSEYFKAENTRQPVPVYNCDAADYTRNSEVQVAQYEIKDNVVIVTFTEGVEAEDVSYVKVNLQVKAAVREAALREDGNAEVKLEREDIVVVLPQVVEEQADSGEAKTEESKTNKAEDGKSDETLENTIDNETDNSQKENEEEQIPEPDTEKTVLEPAQTDDEDSSKDIESDKKGFFTKTRKFLGELFGFTAKTSTGTVDDFDRISYEKYNITVKPDSMLTGGTIEIASNQDGYGKTDPNLSIRFQIKFDVSDEYLETTYEENAQAIMEQNGFAEAMLDAPLGPKWKAFLNGLDDSVLPPLMYELNLNKNTDQKMIVVPKEVQGTETPLVDGAGEELGVYSVSEEGIVTFRFHKSMYVFSNASAGAGFDFIVNADNLKEGEKTDIIWDDQAQTIVGTSHIDGGGTGDPDNDPYEVIKSAPVSVDTPYIDYTIRVQAPKGKKLNGMILKDIIPEGLTLISAELNGEDIAADGKEIGDFVTDGKFVYTIPEDESKYDKESAVFSVRMGITDFKKFSGSNTFKNTASLYEKDTENPKAESDEIATDMKFEVISKSGVQNPQDGTKFDWSVNVNTKFSSVLASSYLVDRICINTQKYLFNSFNIDGVSIGNVRNSDNRKEGITLTDTMEPLTDQKLNELSRNLGGDTDTPFYFEYTADDNNIYGVVVIPFNQFANKNVKLTYQTQLTDTNVFAPDYVAPDSLKNDVKFFYDKIVSTGIIGVLPDPDLINVTKDDPFKAELGSKSAGTYDKNTQTLSWNFKLNYYAADIKGMKIADTLAPDVYDLNSLAVTWVKEVRGGDGETGVLSETPDAQGRGYTMDDSGNLLISMGDVSADEMYHLTIKAKVIDKSFLSRQDAGGKAFHNAAKITGNVNGQSKETETSADKTINNTLIEKSVVGGYDYKEHTFTWKVVVNPDHIPVKNMVMRDILPVGNEWFELVSVERKPLSGPSVQGTISAKNVATGTVSFGDGGTSFSYVPGTEETDSEGKSHKVEKFTLVPAGETTDAYIFTLKTKVTDEYLMENSPLSKENGNAEYTITCLNRAELQGSVYEEAISASDGANSPATIKDSIISKKGKFIPSEGSLEWTVDVNSEGLDLSGYTIIEDLNSAGAGDYMELVQESIKIYKSQVAADGTITHEEADDITNDFVIKNKTDKGFNITIPDKFKTTPLQLVFKTQLIQNCSLSDVKNQVSLESGNKAPIVSEKADGGSGGNFNLEHFVTHTPLPTILIRKVSVNSDELVIGGINFSLIKGTENNGVYTFDETGKNRVTSNATGFALYSRLKTDEVYQIKEDKTSAGNVGYDGDVVEYVKLSPTSLGNNEPRQEKIKVNGKTEEQTLTILYPDSSGQYVKNIITLKNTPENTGKIEFIKKGPKSNNDTTSIALVESKFRITRDGDSTWKLQGTENNTVASDSNGKVSFYNVDPGTYTIEELSTQNGNYKVGGKLKAEVRKENGNYISTLTLDGAQPFTLTKDDTGSGYTVTDQLIKGSISLQKVDAKSTGINLQGAEFGIYKSEDDAVKKQNPIAKKTTGSNGKCIFDNLDYGAYWIAEITPPKGYEKTSELIEITTDGLDTDKNDGVSFSYDCGKIKNTRVSGTLSLTKQNDKQTPDKLKDRTFYLTPKDNATKAYLPSGVEYYTSTLKRGNNGEYEFADIPWGNYVLTETRPSDDDPYNTEGIKITISQENMTVDYDDSTKPEGTFTYTVESEVGSGIVTNTLLKTNLKVNKTVLNQDGASDTNQDKYFDGDKLSDVTFTVTGKDYYGQDFIQEQSTRNGTLTFTDIPVGEKDSSYTLKETRKGGYLNPKEWTFTVTADKGKAIVGNLQEVAAAGTEGTATLDDSKTTPVISVTNKPILGQISFNKKSFVTGKLDGLNDNGLAGAEFTLYAVNDSGAETLAYTEKSDETGTVQFNNIIFGQKYNLYEKTAPEGYKYPSENNSSGKGHYLATITEDDLIGSEQAPENFNYVIMNKGEVKEGNVQNSLIQAKVSFHKQNEDNESLAGIDFKVYRHSDNVISANGENMSLDAAGDTYHLYTPEPKITSNGKGDFSIDELACGEYLLVEQYEQGIELQDGHSGEAIYIKIEEDKNNVGTAVVTVKENEDYKGVEGTNGEYTLTAGDLTSADWKTLSSVNGVYEIINRLKYGYVQINKVIGERTSESGALTSTGIALKDAVFEIYQGEAAQGNVYLTLATDGNGHFVHEQDGSYQDYNNSDIKKHLFYGSYTIKEKSAPAGYKTDTEEYTFELSDDNGGHKGTAWISTGGTDTGESGIVYKKTGNNLDKNANYFANERVRAAINLNKTGKFAEGQEAALSGAEFIITSGDTEVASLKDQNNGSYVLSNENPKGGVYDAKDSSGGAYLYQDSAGVWKIIPGTYTVTETKAPAGYETASFTCTISDTGEIQCSDSNGAADLNVDAATSVINLQDVPVELTITKTDMAGKELSGAEFTVKGKFAEKPDTQQIKSLTEIQTGQLIAGNDYTLNETKAPDGYILNSEDVIFTVNKDGTLVIAGAQDWVSAAQSNIIFKDAPIEITLKKQNEKAEPLPGVKFELEDITPGVTADPNTIIMEGNGEAKLSGLIGGHNYRLTETEAGVEYFVPAEAIYFTVKEDGTLNITQGNHTEALDVKGTTLTISNEKINAAVTLQKLDKTSGEPMKGIEFKLTWSDGEKTLEVTRTTDENGLVTFKDLSKHKYTLTETGRDVNYDISDTNAFIAEFEIVNDCHGETLDIKESQAGTATPFNLTLIQGQWNDQGILNERRTGSVSLVKKGNVNGNGTQSVVLPGAEFALFDSQGNPVKDIQGQDITRITDENGTFIIEGLSWGDYYLQETAAPDGYRLDETKLEFTIGYGQLTKAFNSNEPGNKDNVVNNPTKLTIEKKAAGAEGIITGAVFTIEGKFADGVSGEKEYDMTSAGSLTLLKELIAGETYTLTETTAPAGYELAAPITFTVARNGDIMIDSSRQDNDTVTVEDQPIEIKLVKADSADKGTFLAGAEFSLRDETAGLDAETVISKGEAVVLPGMIQGHTYTLTETKAPAGYILPKLKPEVRFTVGTDGKVTFEDNTDAAITGTKTDTIVVSDNAIKTMLEKTDLTGEKLTGWEFEVTGIFTQGGGIPDEAETVIQVDDTHKDALNGHLIAGNRYTIKETKEPEGYILLEEIITIEVQPDGSLKQILEEGAESAAKIENNGDIKVLISDEPTKFFLNKVSSEPNGKEKISGAVLEIKDKDGKSLNPRRTWTSDGTSLGEITHLPKGTYILEETTTPYGYKTAASITFTLDEKNEITLAQESKGDIAKDGDGNYIITMTDTYIRGHVELTKTLTTLQGETVPLAGAKFSLYREKTGKEEKDTLLAEELTTDSDGKLTTIGNEIVRKDSKEKLAKGLGQGSYYLVETQAPANAVLDNTEHRFEIQAKNHGEEDDAFVKVKAENKEFTAAVTLKKIEDADHDSQGISGAEFTLAYKAPGEENFTNLTSEIVTGQNGMAAIPNLKKGDYILTETANQGYQPDKFLNCRFTISDKDAFKTYQVNSANEEISLTETDAEGNPLEKNAVLTEKGIENTRIQGSVTLLKVDGKKTDKQLKGTEFKLMKEAADEGFINWLTSLFTGKKYQAAGAVSGEELAEDQGGRLTIENLEWGKYKLIETKAVDGYKNDARELSFEINRQNQKASVETDGGKVFNFQNTLTIRKENADKEPLAGAEFTITKKGENIPVRTVTTGNGEDGLQPGEITLTGELVGGTTYVLHETKAPKGYILPNESADITFTMEQDGRVTVGGKQQPDDVITVTNQPIEVKLVKTDSQDKDVFLEGAKFNLQDETAGQEAVTVTSQGEEILLPGMIQGHTYTLTETKAPAGYILPNQNHETKFRVETDGTVTFTESSAVTGTGTDTITVADDTMKVKLEKVDPTGEILTGWEFEVKGIFAGDSGLADEAETAIKVDDTHKEALNGRLIAGNRYTITETKEPEGYILLTEVITVEARADGSLVQILEAGKDSAVKIEDNGNINVLITNEPTRFFLDKVSNEPDGKTRINGAVLEIRDADGKPLNPEIKWTSDGSNPGEIVNLPKGSYTLVETTTPKGYFTADPIGFELREDNSIALSQDSGGTAAKGSDGNYTITMMDIFIRGEVEFVKYKKVMEACADGTLEGVPEAEHSIPAGGAEFTLYQDAQAAKPVTQAGGSPVTAVSQADGKVRFEQIPMGTYYIKETKAPAGCMAEEEIYKAVINGEGKCQGLERTDDSSVEGNVVVNDVFRTDISMKKVSEQDPDTVLPGSTYGLYKRTSEIPKVNAARMLMSAPKAASEDELEGWTLIATSVTDKDGMLAFKGVLMDTEYMIRELEAPDGSQVSEKPVRITFAADSVTGEVKIVSIDTGDGTAEVDPDTGEIIWREPPIMLGFLKTDEAGVPLPGAELELQDMEGNVLESWTSTDSQYVIYGDQMDGRIKANEQYRLAEIKAPKGYTIADSIVFTVEEKLTGPGEEFIQQIVMSDEETSFGVNKIAEDTKEPLRGAELAVYEADAPEGAEPAKTNKGEKAAWTTDGSVMRLKGLAAGEYVLREEAAPEGYAKAEDITFILKEDGRVVIDGKDAEDNVIVMTDARVKAEPEKPEKPETPETPKKPEKSTETTKSAKSSGAKTGDESPIVPFTLLAVLSMGTVIYIRRRRYSKR